MVAERCPQCQGPLVPVRYPGGYLNREQWASQRAGDWYCTACPPNNRSSGNQYSYWWDHEIRRVTHPARSPSDHLVEPCPTVPVQIGEGTRDIDAGVAPLVERLNRVPGIRTVSSCEGHPLSPHDQRAYVAFMLGGVDVELRVGVWDVPRLVRELDLRNAEREMTASVIRAAQRCLAARSGTSTMVDRLRVLSSALNTLRNLREPSPSSTPPRTTPTLPSPSEGFKTGR